MGTLEKVLDQISGYVWGIPLLVLLFGTHLFLTFRLGFIQRYFPGDKDVLYQNKGG